MPPAAPAIDPSTIAAVIEANINAYLLSFARLPGALLHDDGRSVWIDSGTATPTFNAVVSAHFSLDSVDAQIESVLSQFRRRSRPVTWHVGPSTEPADLGRFLLAHGMTHSEDEPGMAIDIDRLQEEGTVPPGLTIDMVRDKRGLEAWVSVWLFPVPDDGRRRYLNALRQLGLHGDLPRRYYLGRLDGTPVATAELFAFAGVAGVHNVVTLPEARRQGIGTAMTRRVLDDARALGCRVGALTASPSGIGSYRRIGFEEYCWFRRFEWHPGQGAAHHQTES